MQAHVLPAASSAADGGGTGVLDPPTPERPPRRGRRRRGADPPAGGGDDGWSGDGWSGGSGDEDGEGSRGAGEFAFRFVLAASGTLFVIFLAVCLEQSGGLTAWRQPGAPRPPAGLWVSTLLILTSSVPMVLATRASRRGAGPRAASWLGWTTLLGLGFLGVQALLWRQTLADGRTPASSAYETSFYTLTGLHAFHVVSGLPFFGWLWLRARRAAGTAEWAVPLRLGSVYWHFLSAVWLILFAVLYLAPAGGAA